MENIDFLSEEAHSETHLLRAFFSLEAKGLQNKAPFPAMLKAPGMEQEDNTETRLYNMQDLGFLHQTTTQTPASTEPANIKLSSVSTKVLAVPR